MSPMTVGIPDKTETPTFSPLGDARSRSDLVVESIRGAILSGNLRPGEVLVERRIADELQVSKTPVREALIVLARSGLVEVTRNRGSAVRELTLGEVRDIYEMRALIEPRAVASAVDNPATSFAEAQAALDEASAFSAAGGNGDRALANRRFHRAMYRGCTNRFLVASLDRMQDLTALATTGILWEKWPTWNREADEHQEQLDAAKRGYSKRVEALVRTHIERSLERIKTLQDD